MAKLEHWVASIFADPVTKQPCSPDVYMNAEGLIDARVFLKNTYGYGDWSAGQEFYEEKFLRNDSKTVQAYQDEIDYDRPCYQHFIMEGRILDCGGGAGSVREFLSDDVEFVSTDPHLYAPVLISEARKAAYSCFRRPLNFIGSMAEFQPFVEGSFDWVHMRSMLDHVQVADLALLEARRVLKLGGRVLIGIYVDGGRSGTVSFVRQLKDSIKECLEFVGIERWKDHHIWHPTYKNLLKLISDNGFEVEDTFWQPQWKGMVCYVSARKL